MRSRPAIGAVEAAYAVERSEQAWIYGICEAAESLGAPGLGVVVARYDPNPAPWRRRAVARLGASDDLMALYDRLDDWGAQHPSEGPLLHRRLICETSSEGLIRMRQPPNLIELAGGAEIGVKDCFAVQGLESSGQGLCMMVGLPEVRSVPSRTRNLWRRVAVHLSAALRLRRAFESADARADDDEGDAIFERGRCVHLRTSVEAKLPALREAVAAVDRARSPAGQDDPAQALELWAGLFAGEYSFVDRFDTDGRRFLVARRNAPDLADDRALTRRERHAVVALLQCQTQSLAAYALGLSPSTLRTHLLRAMRKLGVKSLEGLFEVAGVLAGPTEIARAASALPRRRA